MIDLVAVGIVVLVAARGWTRGTLPMALWGLSLVIGSVAAAFFARPVGDVLADALSMTPLLAWPLGGAVVAGVATALTRLVLRRVERSRPPAGAWLDATPDRVGGALVGAGVGAALAVFAAWLVTSLGSVTGRQDEVAASVVGRASGRVAEPVVRVLAGRATGDAVVGASVAWLVSNPDEAKETAATLLADGRLRTLAADPGIRSALASGNTDALAASPLLAELAGDDAFLRAARHIRLLGDTREPPTPRELADAASEKLGPLVRAADELRRDPAVRRIVERSEVGRALERGDLAQVLTDPDFRELLDRVAQKLRETR